MKLDPIFEPGEYLKEVMMNQNRVEEAHGLFKEKIEIRNQEPKRYEDYLILNRSELFKNSIEMDYKTLDD